MKDATMAEVTVKQLADVVGIPVDKLLTQMSEAGLSHKHADEIVSSEQKQVLLGYLKTSHGEVGDEVKKVTLRRKSLSTLKASGSQSGARGKTVNIEVRKKRTYVRRKPGQTTENVDVPEPEEVVESPELPTVPVIEEELSEAPEIEELSEAPLIEADAKPEEPEAEVIAPVEEVVDSSAESEVSESPLETVADKPEKVIQDPIQAAREQARLQKEAALRRAAEQKRQREKDVLKQAQLNKQKAILKRRQKAESKKQAAAPKVETKPVERVLTPAQRKEQENIRKVAEDKARKETLEQAAKIARDLEKRGDDGLGKASEGAELELGSDIVTEAFDASIAQEDRRTKKESSTKRKARKAKMLKKSHQFTMPVEARIYEIEVGNAIAASDLAQKMKVKGTEVVKSLMKMGVMASLNQEIDQDTAVLVIEDLGHKAKIVSDNALEESLTDLLIHNQSEIETGKRAPVVTIMGHVDHGKTSLLDFIRSTKVTAGEAGGITQHIGAYHVETGHGMITFLDTPGHAAFSAMRARGAECTDVVILVVAADDGVMPQTKEAVSHAKASGAAIIVAVNKIDKEGADPERVKTELSAIDVIPEEWGGDNQFIEVSAKTGVGIDELLDAVLLQSEMLDLNVQMMGAAKGVVIESRVDRERGVVASFLVQAGVLNVGDMVLVGKYFGRVRAMTNEDGQAASDVGPSMPVEILGLPSAPSVGDDFQVVPDEKKAREVAEFRHENERRHKLATQRATHLENLFDSMGREEASVQNIVLKTDVRGSLEAIKAALHELSTEEVKVAIVSDGVGGIAESDVNLAMSSGAVIMGFNVRADTAARALSQKESIEIRYYSIIYELIDDVKSAMSGLLAPELREEILGVAEVRDVYRSSKFGAVAGCIVIEGTLYRNKRIRVLRDDVVIFEGELESLRRFKDDVSEVRNGIECGLAVKSYNDVKAGDKIEVFEVNEITRSL